jgi:uncharacterized protein (DUF1778 family)
MPGALKTRQRQSRKIERVEARLHPEQKRRIEHAADLEGTSISDFIVSSAVDAATRAIQQHESWTLSGRDREIFVNALLNPPSPNRRIRAAARRYKAAVSSL